MSVNLLDQRDLGDLLICIKGERLVNYRGSRGNHEEYQPIKSLSIGCEIP